MIEKKKKFTWMVCSVFNWGLFLNFFSKKLVASCSLGPDATAWYEKKAPAGSTL